MAQIILDEDDVLIEHIGPPPVDLSDELAAEHTKVAQLESVNDQLEATNVALTAKLASMLKEARETVTAGEQP